MSAWNPRRHDASLANPIGECACAECTRYDWEAAGSEGSLAAYRRMWWPEAWAK